MDYSNLFQYFLSICYGPHIENSNFFVYLFVNFFLEIIVMTGEPIHAASEMTPRAPAISFSSEK